VKTTLKASSKMSLADSEKSSNNKTLRMKLKEKIGEKGKLTKIKKFTQTSYSSKIITPLSQSPASHPKRIKT